jgi:hypothetical protein
MKLKTLLSAIAIALVSAGTVNAQKTSLSTGEVLKRGELMQSNNGSFVFAAHTGAGGGQFCSYPAKNGKIQSYLPFSCFGHHSQGNVRLELWKDGNLVILNEKNEVKWASSTTPDGDPRFKDSRLKPVKLIVGNDGIIGLHSASGERVWFHKK